jgi:hypothetical protein
VDLKPGDRRVADEGEDGERRPAKGKRGKGVSFDEVPHIMSRLAVGCMRLKLSGKLDELELDDV